MKRKVTAVFSAEELSTLIMDNMEGAVAKVSVPRTKGELPTATITVSSEVLMTALAAGLSEDGDEVDASELANMEMSVKKPTEGQTAGNVELTY